MSQPDSLTQLEERYTFLEQHVAEQDKAILELADDLKRLRQVLDGLRSEFDASRDPPDSAPEERPPHY